MILNPKKKCRQSTRAEGRERDGPASSDSVDNFSRRQSTKRVPRQRKHESLDSHNDHSGESRGLDDFSDRDAVSSQKNNRQSSKKPARRPKPDSIPAVLLCLSEPTTPSGSDPANSSSGTGSGQTPRDISPSDSSPDKTRKRKSERRTPKKLSKSDESDIEKSPHTKRRSVRPNRTPSLGFSADQQQFGGALSEESESQVSSNPTIIQEVEVNKILQPELSPKPNTEVVLTEKDLYDYVMGHGSLDTIVAERTNAVYNRRANDLKQRDVKSMTQQDMFNYMFGGENIENLMPKPADDEKGSSDTTVEEKVGPLIVVTTVADTTPTKLKRRSSEFLGATSNEEENPTSSADHSISAESGAPETQPKAKKPIPHIGIVSTVGDPAPRSEGGGGATGGARGGERSPRGNSSLSKKPHHSPPKADTSPRDLTVTRESAPSSPRSPRTIVLKKPPSSPSLARANHHPPVHHVHTEPPSLRVSDADIGDLAGSVSEILRSEDMDFDEQVKLEMLAIQQAVKDAKQNVPPELLITEVIPEDQIVIPENTSPSPSPDKTPLSSPGYSMLKSKSIVTLPSGTSPGGVAVSHKPFSTDPGTRRLSDPNKPDLDLLREKVHTTKIRSHQPSLSLGGRAASKDTILMSPALRSPAVESKDFEQDTKHVTEMLLTLGSYIERTENPLFFKFKHPVLRHVLVETMLPSKLPAIHTKIAEYLEKNPDACPPPAVKHLAHHWRKAQRPEIAIGYYSQLVETAMRAFMHRKATKLLLKAIQLQESCSASSQIKESVIAIANLEKWHRQLGETFYNLGETEKAIFHLTKALDTTVQSLPEQESVQFPLLEYLEQSNWNETSKSGLQNAGKSTRKLKKSQSSSNSEVVRIFLCFAQVFYYRSMANVLTNFTLSALSVAEGLGFGSAELLRALASNVLAAGITKHEHFSVHYSKLGQSLFKEQWSRRAWLSEGISKSGFADWKGANLLLEQAFRHSETTGDMRTFTECALHLSFNCFFTGVFKNSENHALIAFDAACTRGDLQIQIMSLLAMANLAYSCGKLEVFYTRMNDIEPYLGQGINYQMTETDKILYYGLLAVYHLKKRDEPKAYQYAILVDDVFEAKDVQPTVWWTVLGLYYSVLVKASLYKSTAGWKEGTHKTIPALKQKKLLQNLTTTGKRAQDFATKFNSTTSVVLITSALIDHCQGKKTQAFLDAIEKGTQYSMKYFVAVAHHWITVLISISDNAQTQARVNHVNRAMNLFLEMDIFETMLIWLNY